MTIKELADRYPFLLPYNVLTGKLSDKYDYTFTLLDCMPRGWRDRFGIKMCEEIRTALIKANCFEEYRVFQIKEKWGSLRWYDFGHPDEVEDIINKYEELSKTVCIECGCDGHIANDNGWWHPLCESCCEERGIEHDG